jgi:hypothetical protein
MPSSSALVERGHTLPADDHIGVADWRLAFRQSRFVEATGDAGSSIVFDVLVHFRQGGSVGRLVFDGGFVDRIDHWASRGMDTLYIPAPSSNADFNMVFLPLARAQGPGRALPGRIFAHRSAVRRDGANALDLTAAINLYVDFNWVDNGVLRH